MENTAVALRDTTAIWQDTEKIRSLFAPTLTDKEFSFFVSLGLGLGANPFTREIWAVKYDANKPASVFLGRDFYRKKAEEQPDYNGHVAESVYENDDFKVEDGTPRHTYSLKDRGKLLGAYSVLWRKGIDHPFFTFVELIEYNKGFSNWKSMPATMIKKVAEAQTLRGGYQGIFAGTYDESESWIDTPALPPAPQSKKPVTAPPQAKPQAETTCNQNEPPADWQPQDEPPSSTYEQQDNVRLITAGQVKLVFAKCKAAGITEDDFKAYLDRCFGIQHRDKIPFDRLNSVLEWIDLKAAEAK